jgi:hypothetical protein
MVHRYGVRSHQRAGRKVVCLIIPQITPAAGSEAMLSAARGDCSGFFSGLINKIDLIFSRGPERGTRLA